MLAEKCHINNIHVTCDLLVFSYRQLALAIREVTILGFTYIYGTAA